MTVKQRLEKIYATLPHGVSLVAVSKFHPAEALNEAYEAGQRVFGESRVQELLVKHEALPKDIEWQMIGHLQTNKVKQVVGKVSLIHSVDSQRLLEAINKEAAKQGIIQDILLEINIGQEDSKSGLCKEELPSILEKMGDFMINISQTLVRS